MWEEKDDRWLISLGLTSGRLRFCDVLPKKKNVLIKNMLTCTSWSSSDVRNKLLNGIRELVLCCFGIIKKIKKNKGLNILSTNFGKICKQEDKKKVVFKSSLYAMCAEYYPKRNFNNNNNYCLKTNLIPKDYAGRNVARDLTKFHNLCHTENCLQAHVNIMGWRWCNTVIIREKKCSHY